MVPDGTAGLCGRRLCTGDACRLEVCSTRNFPRSTILCRCAAIKRLRVFRVFALKTGRMSAQFVSEPPQTGMSVLPHIDNFVSMYGY